MARIILRVMNPSGVKAKKTQARITKPVPQKMSTMLEFFKNKLMSQSEIIKPSATNPAIV
jgi:hypothetical protein